MLLHLIQEACIKPKKRKHMKKDQKRILCPQKETCEKRKRKGEMNEILWKSTKKIERACENDVSGLEIIAV
jgi:hypothetical protein